MKKLISIVIPIYNEEGNISLMYTTLTSVLKKIDYRREIIFINDGSTDESQKILHTISQKDATVKYLEFSRNFGKEAATSAGLYYAKGNATIMIDADLQHPIELIPDFIKKWEQGAEIVIGIRNKNKGERMIEKIGSHFFYKIMNAIGETKVISKATDFRLIDKKVIEEFNKFTERQRLTRGILDWIGFTKDYVYFDANMRNTGKANYSISKKFKLATSSFIANSLIPLKLAGYLGLIITFFSSILGIFIFIEQYILADPWNMNFSGTAILAVLTLFLVGIILMCLGIIALYIANIQTEVMNRPLYVVKTKKNITL